jgi:hypothetical protein
MVGRGTRLEYGIKNLVTARAEGIPITKPDCLVLDVVDRTTNHLLVDFARAFDLPEDVEMDGIDLLTAKDKLKRERRRRGKEDPDDISDVALAAHAEEHELFSVRFQPEVLQHSSLQWHLLSPDFYALFIPNRGGRLYLYRNQERVHVLSGVGLTNNREGFTEHFECANKKFAFGFAHADQLVRVKLGERVYDQCERRISGDWRNAPAPAGQQKLLAAAYEAAGATVPPQLTKGLANMLFAKWMAMRQRGKRMC